LGSQQDFDLIADYLFQIADLEKSAFESLSKIKWLS